MLTKCSFTAESQHFDITGSVRSDCLGTTSVHAATGHQTCDGALQYGLHVTTVLLVRSPTLLQQRDVI